MNFIRGDTFSFKILIKYADDTPITKEDISTIFVTFKKNIHTDRIIFQKDINDILIDEEGYIHIIFKPEDTEKLSYGKYVFDVEVTTLSGVRKTKLFNIELQGETTFHNGGDMSEN